MSFGLKLFRKTKGLAQNLTQTKTFWNFKYTVRSKRFRTDFFLKSKILFEGTYLFLIQNSLHWHIYRLLRGRTVSEKLPKIPLFRSSLIHHWRFLGSQQHPQSLTSFSTWGTDNSLAEINLESTGCNSFGGQKLGKTYSFVGGSIIVQQEQISREEHSWTNPLNEVQDAISYAFIKFCIYCFSLWYEFFVHYGLRVEKIIKHGLDAGRLEFQFLRLGGYLTKPIQNSLTLLRGHRQNTRYHLP